MQGNPETPDFPDPYCVKPNALIRGWRMQIAVQQSREMAIAIWDSKDAEKC
jgi:hypothetical protein